MASSASRAVQSLTKFRPKFPEKWKGGRLERVRDYFMHIVTDYQAAVRDMVQDMKDSPRKAGVYLSLLGAGAVLVCTNPSELSFQEGVWRCHHDLLLLGDPIRNRASDAHVTFLMDRHREGTLRYTSCGFFSLVWTAQSDPQTDTFEARCGLVKPQWKDFPSQVVDVGVLGRWVRLTRAMVDYDINADEWDENGRKKGSPPLPSSSTTS